MAALHGKRTMCRRCTVTREVTSTRSVVQQQTGVLTTSFEHTDEIGWKKCITLTSDFENRLHWFSDKGFGHLTATRVVYHVNYSVCNSANIQQFRVGWCCTCCVISTNIQWATVTNLRASMCTKLARCCVFSFWQPPLIILTTLKKNNMNMLSKVSWSYFPCPQSISRHCRQWPARLRGFPCCRLLINLLVSKTINLLETQNHPIDVSLSLSMSSSEECESMAWRHRGNDLLTRTECWLRALGAGIVNYSTQPCEDRHKRTAWNKGQAQVSSK